MRPATYDAEQIFFPPRRARMLGTDDSTLQTIRQVSFDDLAPVLRLLRTRHLRQNFCVHVASERLFSFSSQFYIRSHVAPTDGRDKFDEATSATHL